MSPSETNKPHDRIAGAGSIVEATILSERAIWSYDLSAISRRLERRGMNDVARVETEFRKLATLWYRNPDAFITPSAKLDDFWHEFILDTKRYQAFTDQVYGHYIHHIPCDAELEDHGEDIARTLAAYREAFGEPDPAVWAGMDHAICGGTK